MCHRIDSYIYIWRLCVFNLSYFQCCRKNQKLHKNLAFLKTSAKVLIAIEVTGVVISYCVWHRINQSRDFRKYLNKDWPLVLEGYYRIGEYIDKDSNEIIRKNDLACWTAEKNRSVQK